MSALSVIAITAGLIVLSAFFVIIEFSLLAARRHRLEDAAPSSASSRAAVRSLNELTIMLAGAQLGITACTFALGAVTKPAVHYAMTPMFDAWGFSPWIADAAAFGLALVLVTFLHLVVGEMTPKSWAIAHPERAARVIALPARAFIGLFRPLLTWINSMANRLVSAAGVEPINRAAAAGYDSETIRQLVEDSTQAGVLDVDAGSQMARFIGLESLTVDDVLATRSGAPTQVPAAATAADVQRAAQTSGHLRILIGPEASASPMVVHVRDTLQAEGDEPAERFARPALAVEAGTSVYEVFRRMRENSEQLVVVRTDERFTGVITWADVLKQVWPAVEQHAAGTPRTD
ncbi:CNNM domain-containing protein [Nesterenkonia sp. NBAIMH1]|uniref:CNNM domain-containing protein n=1 Tax=Nesterenkonia sp. NBAIMH1 TaxID=2600320 RepID=UPI0011B6DBBE|nr:CNNM domain-containing protein [Nesterenkonia sp. NBAIMH1]